MFNNLTEKLNSVFKKLNSKGKLTEDDVKVAMKEIKLALLEADVNFKVVKKFIKAVKLKAIDQEILKSLTPGQQVVKIVHDELIKVMGEGNEDIKFSPKAPTIIMLVGLQGSGKTTTVSKLSLLFKKKGKKVLMVAGDIYRPAAIKQLEVLGEQNEIETFSMGTSHDVVNIFSAALKHAEDKGHDIVVLDTAGRLHIDEVMMEELEDVRKKIDPHEVLLVVDAMMGQDAVTTAKTFNEKLSIDGIILTKLDGDTRGGAALSARYVTGKPIKFVGIGEKSTEFEVFHPERMVSRILDMGDIMTFIEKAEAAIDKEEMEKLEKKLRKQQFTLEDFFSQLKQIKKMGPLDQLLGMIPGMGSMGKMSGLSFDNKEFKQMEAIMSSMTKEERRKPEIIKSSRKKRISKGSGTEVRAVNQLLKQFEQMKKMMKQMGKLEKMMKGGGGGFPFMGF